MTAVVLLLLVVAAVCFAMALGRSARVNWMAAGLLAWAVAVILERVERLVV